MATIPEVTPTEGTTELGPEVTPLPETGPSETEDMLEEMNRAILALQTKFEALAIASANTTLQELVNASSTPAISPCKPRDLKLSGLITRTTPSTPPVTLTLGEQLADALTNPETLPPKPVTSREPLAKVPNFELPTFTPDDLETWLRRFARWLRLTGLHDSSDMSKIDWVVFSCKDAKVNKLLSDIAEDGPSWKSFLEKLKGLFPVVETDVDLRMQIAALPVLPDRPTPAAVKQLVLELKVLHAKFQAGALTDQDQLLQLLSKIPQRLWQELRTHRADRLRAETFSGLVDLLLERARDNLVEEHIEAQRKYLFAKPGGRALNYIEGDDLFAEYEADENLYAMGKG